MAASDPTWSVPTPTGTLQGAAAFSWDGSAWQPAGRAGPSVGTPTGVLRGVAPFARDSNGDWQPVARAGPGVPTSSGTLDGIALYTWNGAAWVPPYGGPGCATPSGTLRGVAGFFWDGTAWQPSGQAGPSVATPYGVLTGMAMFAWDGTSWAVGAPATLDLSFMTPGTLDPRVTFTRASTGTYFDVAGVLQTAATNTPRWDYDPVTHALNGLLIEEARTNIVNNSTMVGAAAGTPGTDPTGWNSTNTVGLTRTIALGNESGIAYIDYRFQAAASTGGPTSVFFGPTNLAAIPALPGQIYSGSLYVSLSGGSFAGVSNVGMRMLQWNSAGTNLGAFASAFFNLAGFTVGDPLTKTHQTWVFPATVASTAFVQLFLQFTVAAGPVDFTIRIGAPQLEAGTFPTSYIPTTAAAATRAVDVATMPTGAWFNAVRGSCVIDLMLPQVIASSNIAIVGLDQGAVTDTIESRQQGATTNFGVVSFTANVNRNGPVVPIAPFIAGQAARAGFTYDTASLVLSAAKSASPAVPLVTTGMPLAISRVTFGTGRNTPLNGYIRRVRFWQRVLSNAELQAVTT